MLPKISQPTFSVTQPSTGEKITLRPFLVKEEKILLMAKESGEKADIYDAIKQIINNCVVDKGFDVNSIPIFDMEYIFIKLRAASVSNIVNFKVEDSTDGIEYDLELDLNEVEIIYPENHEKKIMIDDNVGIIMKYPTPAISEKIKNIDNLAGITQATISESIDVVFDEDDAYDWNKATENEKEEFLDSLTINTYNMIQTFFETSPKIEHIVNYTNSEGTEKKVVFRELNDFFSLG